MEILGIQFQTASFINDIVQLNIVRMGSKQLVFTLSVDQNLPAMFFGDDIRLRQVLNNLLSNAFKYTDKGTVALSFWAEQRPQGADDDSVFVARISDTGQGMTEEQLAALFDEYARFNLISNRGIEGTGLGMTIVLSIVKLMNGTIEATSVVDKGSTFTVRIPLKKAGGEMLGAAGLTALSPNLST